MENKIYKNVRYAELLTFNSHPNYVQLLNTQEWDSKRLQILYRDKCKCKICNVKGHIFRNNGFYEKLFDDELDFYKKKKIRELKEYIEDDITLQQLSSSDIDIIFRKKDFSYKPISLEKRIILNVHHKYYITNYLPWEYNEECLITVCVDCHLYIHENEEIPVYTSNDFSEKLSLKKCSRCKGMGYIDYYNFYMDGICFKCNGEKFVTN